MMANSASTFLTLDFVSGRQQELKEGPGPSHLYEFSRLFQSEANGEGRGKLHAPPHLAKDTRDERLFVPSFVRSFIHRFIHSLNLNPLHRMKTMNCLKLFHNASC